MTAVMIGDGKCVAAGGARFQWHMISIADIDLIARNTGGKWGRVIDWRTLKVEWSDWDERHGRKSREAAVREMGIDRIQLLNR
jgi:hypothetical protein